jgi:3-dehydroquinate synthase
MTTGPDRIILTGFSGTGKSTVARLLAGRLGWEWRDTDAMIEEAAGCSIADIFEREGEPAFRRREAEALLQALAEPRRVVATGGGAVLASVNRRTMAAAGLVFCLQASADRVDERTSPQAHRPVRPLLQRPGEATRLKAERAALYDRADWTVHTDALSAHQVASEILRAYERFGPAIWAIAGRVEAMAADPPSVPAVLDTREAAAVVRTAGSAYPVYVAWGALDRLPAFFDRAGLRGPARVVADRVVLERHHDRLDAALQSFGATSHLFEPGEASKSLDAAALLYDQLVAERAERSQPVVAFGGGVAGDLAGFVAATYLRGLPLVHVPTTLLAMVDSSIGGKTGVNHREGKNLIGAFYQPRMVVADTSLLASLPPRELRSGWAEVLKAAVIFDECFLGRLESQVDAAMALDREVVTAIVARSMELKADVVSQDARESGLRALLNYGHTIGHGIEAATGYGSFLHGEAVAIGMTAAVRLSHWMGLVDAGIVARQDALLARYGLPQRAPGVDRESVRRAMTLDKKVVGGRQRWILLEGIGRTAIRDDVPPELVERALDETIG